VELTVKEMIKQNNSKRESLTPENKLYYENMLVYIRANPLKNDRATEEILLEMLDHILEAQNDGKTAADVFGKSPKELADEIVESLPKEPVMNMMDFIYELGATLFGWYLVVTGIVPLITKEDQTVYLGSILLTGFILILIFVALVFFVFNLIKKDALHDKTKKKRTMWGYGVMIGLLFVGGIVGIILIEPFGSKFTISYPLEFGLGCFLLLAAYLLKRSRESK